jgi:hypothetical protein
MPLITIEPLAMQIRIPEGQDLLAELIKSVHGYICETEDTIINNRQYSHKLAIPRDEIKLFLDKIGLQALPIVVGEGSYFNSLAHAGHVHAYEPVVVADPLESLNRSLSAIVPNVRLNMRTFSEEPLVPYTAMHPKGWLSIRIPQAETQSQDWNAVDDHYVKGLKAYLNLGDPFAIDFTHAGVTYDREFRIDGRELSKFLKLVQLENNSEGASMRDMLSPADREPYQPIIRGDAMETIKVNIAALQPELKEMLLCGQNISQFHVQFVNGPGGLIEIQIPRALHQKRMQISPNRNVLFGEFLAHTFGFSGETSNGGYSLTLKPQELTDFLERDLSLRENNNFWHIRGRTYVELLHSNLGIQPPRSSLRRLEIKDWHLRNPTEPLPRNIPALSNDQIVLQAQRLLASNRQQQQYCRVIGETLRRSGELSTGASEMMRNYLIIMVAPVEGVTLDNMQRSAALATIGATATACMPGRFTKIQQEYKYLVRPESRDQVRTLLLEKIEIFKEGVLPALFDEISPCMHVHAVAAAKALWGQELGLDVDAGRADDNMGCGTSYINNTKKERFKRICQDNMVTNLYEELTQSIDEDSGGLQHASLYRERLTRILRNRGYTLQEIEGVDEHPISGALQGGLLDQFAPLDDNGYPTLARAGLEMMLIDIGVLQG